MYETFFRLTHRPFAAAPAPERYLPTAALEQARATLVRAIDRAEGPGLIIGPAGTGKTILCQLLAQHFRGRFLIAMLASARLGTRRALLQNILFELKLPYRDMDESELRLSLLDHLEPRGETGRDGLLLLVDEAHTLAPRLFEEIRLITNLVRDGQPRVRLVLAGGMALEERLANPKLESLQQRVAARCYLQSMGRDETIYYVQEQVRRAGGEAAQLFADPALRSIHTASDGIPRLVNQLCDHALMLAALGGHKQLGPAGIEEAWADLQQLPAPWHEPERGAAEKGPSVVEFGQLDEPSSTSATLVGPFRIEPGRSTEGATAQSRLDAIESGLSALREDDSEFAAPEFLSAEVPRDGEPDDFSPGDESGTEVELIFHSAHDPFGGGWEAEEVVIDRYAVLEEAKLRRVTSDEGRELAAALTAADRDEEDEAVLVAAGPKLAEIAAEAPLEVAVGGAFDPASDPVMPELSEAALPRRAISLRELAADDRDIIVVAQEQAPARSAAGTNQPRRQEYRQLFSTLRKR